MRRASGQPRLSHGFTLKSGPRSFNLPTRRRSCCSTSPLSKVDLVELVSRALGTVTEVPVGDAPERALEMTHSTRDLPRQNGTSACRPTGDPGDVESGGGMPARAG